MAPPGTDTQRPLALQPSGGNVGIGTTSPQAPQVKLHVNAGTDGTAVKIEGELNKGRLGFVNSGETDSRTVLYRSGGGTPIIPDITTLRNFPPSPKPPSEATVLWTLLKIWAPTVPSGTLPDREATLALVRGDNDEEFMDLYNNAYDQSTEWHFGIRIQRRGSGSYRDFDIEQAFGSGQTEKKLIMAVRPTRKVGIGTKPTPAKLSVKGELFTATGTVSVSGIAVTGTGTLFKQEVDPGDKITISGETRTVATVDSETSLTVDNAFSGSPSGVSMTVVNQLFRVEDSSGNVKLFVTDQGNVAIGTASPLEKLAVAAGEIGLDEISDPAAPAANRARLYLRDNGSGKTQLVVRFSSGAVQVLATQP